MGRSLSGEEAIVASSIRLRRDSYSITAGRATTIQDIYDIFLAIDQLRKTGTLQENSDGVASEKLVATFVRSLFDLCRLKSEYVPVAMVSGLAAVLMAYRQITNVHHDTIMLQDNTPGVYFDLLQRWNLLGPGGPRIRANYWLDHEPQ